MKKAILLSLCLLFFNHCFCWGFFAHQKINYYAVFLLPPKMMVLYKPNIGFLSEHAVDPDKRRYVTAEEGPRHYIDIDRYGKYPFRELPRHWDSAVARFGKDSVTANGIVPWWTLVMLQRLTRAFKQKDQKSIIRLSAEIGHYVSDAHVPLHACHNHNGQFTNQKGIHGLWESRVPELLADKEWDFFMGRARYISNPSAFIWDRVLESAAAADTVLFRERELSNRFSPDQKFSFENRKELVTRQYSAAFSTSYNRLLNGMVERRMRQSVHAIASLWYTAWVNAGQPDLENLSNKTFSPQELEEFAALDAGWQKAAVREQGCY